MLRLIVDSIILVSIFLLPWWLPVLLALAAVFYFRSYYEMLPAALILDSLYSPLTGFFASHMWTLAAVILFLISFEIKKRYVLPQNF